MEIKKELERSLGDTGTDVGRQKLAAYGAKWCQRVRSAALLDAARTGVSGHRTRSRRTVRRLGKALERLVEKMQNLDADSAFLLQLALRDPNGPEIQEGQVDRFTEKLRKSAVQIQAVPIQQWTAVRDEWVRGRIVELAIEYHRVLLASPKPSPGTRFHRFVSTALRHALAPVRASAHNFDRQIKAEVDAWRGLQASQEQIQ